MPKKKEPESSKQEEQPDNFPNPWFETWNKFAEAFKPNPFSTVDVSGFFPSWYKMYDEMAKRFYTVPLSGVVGDVYPRFIDAADTYLRLFRAWSEMGGNINSSPEAMNNLLGLWIDSQKEIFSRLFGLSIPSIAGDNMSDWAGSVKKSLENFTQFYAQNYQPFIDNWKKVSEGMDDIIKGKPDPSKYKEFYNSLIGGYESAFGKFIKMPMIGPSRQVLDKIHKSIDSFIKYCGAIVDFSLVLYSPGKESIEELSKKASYILKGEISQEKYKEFYEMLIKTFEDRFYQLFKTPAFSEVLKTTLEASMEFRKDHFAVVEEILKSTPIITRSEMNDVYQELYNLKKKVKELEKLMRK
ncbi:MAG: poly(R)-hydroxyalkanoic acid synthase subunit PhaE [Planctomycetota bacterium]